ncbi:MAG TPA: ABC-2 family transporter protein [Candidatus Paceibacterota bacterium]|nr:ABC-2 family transporter protein [Verrucomicrobiota bacterium]HOX04397.1 ABC-2 family transporter protein [Verrucomicrobiota bacterium]HRZ43979.1 ABC-2 family transporter protein [Candidatus Paceibacterota bacterium]HRZ94201.1 ABC-2 family transporter protein [Candidatus Paceibacterota bacterium]
MSSTPSNTPSAAPLGPRWWRRYGAVYAALWRNSVAREMGFKWNFLLWIVVEMLWFALQLIFVAVLYQHTDRIATWSQWEVVLLMGTSHFIQQVFGGLFLVNCAQISEHVRTGRMDFMLLLPVNARWVISVRQVDLGAFVNAGSAVAVIVYALSQLGIRPGPLAILGFLILSAAGVMVHYALMFLLSTISFWTVRAQGIVWAYYNMFQIARLPDAAFRGYFRVFFTFAIPMLLVANVPAKLLAEKIESPLEMVLLLALCGLCLAVSELGWRLALRRYTSASS